MIEFGGVDGFPLIVPLGGRRFGAFKLELVSARANLAFTEFQVWAPTKQGGLSNIAFHREARQSSIRDASRGPDRGVNGRIHADPAVITRRETSPWWQVELTRPRSIAHLTLFNQLRRPPAGMSSLRISGRSGGQWQVIYDQQSDGDAVAAVRASLLSVRYRLNSVLNLALIPKIAVDEHTGQPVTRPSQIGPAWRQRRRLEQLLEIVDVLIGLIETPGDTPPSTLKGLRLAADALVPWTRPDRGPFSWFVDLSEFTHLQPRSNIGGNVDVSVSPVPANSFITDPIRHRSANEPADTDTSRLGEAPGYQKGDPIPVTEPLCELLFHSDQLYKWEMWGVTADGPPQLVYDSELTADALVVILQVLRWLGLDTWPTLQSLLRTLEMASRYQAARGTARYFDVDDPGDAVFDNSINELEVRSFIDPARNPVSRTKHGYRTPLRLRDHAKYAKGVKWLIDVMGRDERFSRVFPAYGTLLGFVREGTFIGHDDDADVIVLTDAEGKSGMIEVYDQLWDYLSGRGFKMFSGGRNLPGYNLPVAFDVDGESVHIDIFFSYVENEARIIVDSKTATFEPVDASFVELGRHIEIQGQTFEIPTRSEDLLEFLYGPNWRTPYNPRDVGYSWQRKARKGPRNA